MADKIIPNLPKTEAATFDDLLVVVDTPASSPTNKKITLANLFNKVPTWLGFADTVATMAADVLAIPITASICHKTTGSNVEAGTIVAGTQGQLLMIVLVTDGGGNLGIAASSTVQDTILFQHAGDTVQLLFTNSKWHVMGGTASIS
jgi:hypothetical protein